MDVQRAERTEAARAGQSAAITLWISVKRSVLHRSCQVWSEPGATRASVSEPTKPEFVPDPKALFKRDGLASRRKRPIKLQAGELGAFYSHPGSPAAATDHGVRDLPTPDC